MAPDVKPLDVLRALIARERDRFVTRDNNLFNTAFSDLVRYRRFLERIEDRYRQVGEEFVAGSEAFMAQLRANASGQMRAEQMADLDAREALGLALQLEIESFYLFAKILLDEAARAIEFYFGPVPKMALDSHDDLTKRIGMYARHHQLDLPAGMGRLAVQLSSEVSDFRDQQIAHHKNPRTIRGISFNEQGVTRMILSPLYPKDSDRQAETRALDELLADIDTYLLSIVALLSANAERSRLKVEAKPRR